MEVSPAALLPAFWGLLGAFVYAAPRWVACLVACRQAKQPGWACGGEFIVALVIGAIASGAFHAAVLAVSPLKDTNAISAMIGLLANPTAPKLIGPLSGSLANAISARLGRSAQGEPK